MLFTITDSWLRANLIHNAHGYTPTRDQLRILGEGYPLAKRWLIRAVGKDLSPESKLRFEQRLTKKQIKTEKRSENARPLHGSRAVTTYPADPETSFYKGDIPPWDESLGMFSA